MDPDKRKRLEAAGWREVSLQELLSLSDEEFEQAMQSLKLMAYREILATKQADNEPHMSDELYALAMQAKAANADIDEADLMALIDEALDSTRNNPEEPQ